MKSGVFLRSLAFVAAMLSGGAVVHADVIADWNDVAFQAMNNARQGPPQGVRTMAMVHVAMFDSVNAAQPRYRPYRFDGTPPPGASPEAAAAVAAHTVLSKLFPDQRAAFDEALTTSLAGMPAGAAREAGAGVGLAVAGALVEWRSKDGFGAATQYRPAAQPGVYVMTTLPAGGDAAVAKPWMLTKPEQFRPGPPPALKSELWARDFNETRTVGARTGSTRTPEQSEVAQFWVITGAPAFNGIIRQALASRKLDLVSNARAYALTYMAFTDALIAVFDAKYAYNFWRPITAVRNGDLNGNFAIQRDPAWLPMVDAPLHPEYPCAHCISSGAVLAVLQGIVGDDVPGMTMTSPTLPGVTRKWDKLSAIGEEVSNARIWSGVHYRNSAEVGTRMGRQIAEYALANCMQPR